MALLKLVVAAGVASAGTACFSPELRDCTVTCEAHSDCGNGQMCGADRFCAAPEVAGHCLGGGGRDAGPPPPPRDGDVDGSMTDAAQLQTTLVVTIQDEGHVTVTSGTTTIGTCDSDAPTSGHCTYQVLRGSTVQFVAVPDFDRRFDKWTTEACKDEPSTCVLGVTLATVQVTAKFRR